MWAADAQTRRCAYATRACSRHQDASDSIVVSIYPHGRLLLPSKNYNKSFLKAVQTCAICCPSAAEMTSSAEERQKHGLSDFVEAAKTQLLSGERRIYEYFLCKVGKRLPTRMLFVRHCL